VDRLGRDALAALTVARDLDARSVRVVVTTLGVDSSTPAEGDDEGLEVLPGKRRAGAGGWYCLGQLRDGVERPCGVAGRACSGNYRREIMYCWHAFIASPRPDCWGTVPDAMTASSATTDTGFEP